METGLSTADFLLSFKNNVAVITDGGEYITYGGISDFSELIYQKAGGRCLVFQLCRNQIGSFVGYVSFVSKKIVPLLLDASLETALLQSLISIYRPAYLWLPADRIKDFPDNEIVLESFGYSLMKCFGKTEFLLNEQLALLFTTSGSMGSPKLVRISYENIDSNAGGIAEYLSITVNERPITVLPMNYSFGLSIINSHLLKGATVLLTERSLMEKEFWSFLKNEKATSLSGVPYTYEILDKLRFSKMDLPSITTLTQAGGKLNERLFRSFSELCEQKGKRFFAMYGQTEATARISFLAPEHAVTKTGSIGKAIPGGKINLIDASGTVIAEADITGELVYSGKNVSLGYAECGSDLQKDDENNGILATGDLAKMDNDGFFYIVGRKSRFIKLFGNRISLDEIEEMLKNIIPDCACVGEDDNMIICITESSKEAEILDYVSSKTGINRKAFFVKHIESIPKNTSGKTLYNKLAFTDANSRFS